MQNRCRVEPDVACSGQTRDDPALTNNFGNLRCWNPAALMGTGCNEQRRVCCRHGIKVDTHRDHAGEQLEGWFDVDHPGFDTPWPEAVYVDALPDCDGAVRVPA